eukprot:scaffold14547_cov84-Isochrysis_galbana.AAC.1
MGRRSGSASRANRWQIRCGGAWVPLHSLAPLALISPGSPPELAPPALISPGSPPELAPPALISPESPPELAPLALISPESPRQLAPLALRTMQPRRTHACFLTPGPPCRGLSRQWMQASQSGATQPVQAPQRTDRAAHAADMCERGVPGVGGGG